MTEYDISEAFRRIENDLIESLMRNLKRHRVQEEKEGLTWDMWQALQLRELQRYRKENAHKFDDDFEQIRESIKSLFEEASENGDHEAQIYANMLGVGNYPIVSYGLNDNKVDALIKATQKDFEKAEHAVLRKANDEYRQIIFDAQVYAAQGGTYEQAVDMATKDFRKRGIDSIVYSNGSRHTIKDYASMAIRTGQKRAYLMGLGQRMKKLGIHTVRVNRRDGACPYCTPWIGRVLVDDVYGGGTRKEARQKGLPLLSEAIEQGFLHPNCKDIYSMYIEGISKPEEPVADEEKDIFQRVYDLEQEIRKAEGIRESYFRMAMNSLDPKEGDRYIVLNNKWADRIEELKNQLAELKKQMPSNVLDAVPPIDHSGIREFIEVEREVTTKGVFEIPDGVLTIGERLEDYSWRDVKVERWNVSLNKRVSLPWEGFGQSGRSSFRWNLPEHRYGKPFLIQKKDFEYRLLEKAYRDGGLKENGATRWYKNNGYNFVGRVSIRKYNVPWEVNVGEKDGKYYFIIDELVEEGGVITKATIDKILEREKNVSKQLWDRGVRFRDLTARRGDEWNKAMTEFHTVVGADKPVSLVTPRAYENVVGEELYRGIAPASHLRTDLSMVKTPRECAEQLMEGGVGDCFPSRGIYGDGVAYTSNSIQTGKNYASGWSGSTGGVVVRLKVKDDAKIILFEDAVKLFEEIADVHPNDGSPYFNRSQIGSAHEVGKAMQILGYDVILEPRGDGHNVKFFIILNRDALVGIDGDYIERIL